jgi:hypothetical protein
VARGSIAGFGQTWANAMHGSMMVILNGAMGGDFPNAMAPVQATPVKATPVTATTSGVPMVVKWSSSTARVSECR